MIKSFIDLNVYKNSYKASIDVITTVIPRLPRDERYDLIDQLKRSAKSVPRLIAEGYAKKHQKRGFCKYLDDALGESNEMIVSLSHCKDIFQMDTDSLIDEYDKIGKQLFRLKQAWTNFSLPQDENRKPKRTSQNATRKPVKYRYELL